MASTYELIALLGREGVISLQQALGPAQTYVPKEASHAHPISNAIGYLGMVQLCREHGGSTIWVGSGYARLRRNEEILQLLLAGLTQENVSRVYGITARQVRALTQGEKPKIYGLRARRIQAMRQGLNGFHGPPRPQDLTNETGGNAAPH